MRRSKITSILSKTRHSPFSLAFKLGLERTDYAGGKHQQSVRESVCCWSWFFFFPRKQLAVNSRPPMFAPRTLSSLFSRRLCPSGFADALCHGQISGRNCAARRRSWSIWVTGRQQNQGAPSKQFNLWPVIPSTLAAEKSIMLFLLLDPFLDSRCCGPRRPKSSRWTATPLAGRFCSN